MSRTRSYRVEAGFTLIEIVVAMTILSLALVSLGALTFNVARMSIGSSNASYRLGVVTEQMGRLVVLQVDSLAAEAGCTTETAQPFPHTRCITVTTVSPRVRQVTLIVTPTNATVRPDTVIFDRTKPVEANPFAVP